MIYDANSYLQPWIRQRRETYCIRRLKNSKFFAYKEYSRALIIPRFFLYHSDLPIITKLCLLKKIYIIIYFLLPYSYI